GPPAGRVRHHRTAASARFTFHASRALRNQQRLTIPEITVPYPAIINAALIFAARAHDGQRRKGTNIPYIVHPVGVMLALMHAGENDPELLAAALLHDTLEDTGASLEDLRAKFGPRVAAIVEGCSEPFARDELWETRKQHTVAHLRTAAPEV